MFSSLVSLKRLTKREELWLLLPLQEADKVFEDYYIFAELRLCLQTEETREIIST